MTSLDTDDIPADPRVRREWVKYKLRARGHSLASIARDLGVSRDAPGLALRRPYPRMEYAIAERLGLSAPAIWPERYDPQGRPARGDPERQRAALLAARQRSKRARPRNIYQKEPA